MTNETLDPAFANLIQNVNVQLKSGTIAAPSLVFTTNLTTGLSAPVSNNIVVTAGGAEITRFTTASIEFSKPVCFHDQAPLAPAVATLGCLYKKPGDNGLFWNTIGAGEVNVIGGAAIAWPIAATDVAGNAGAPSFRFSTDTDTGMYLQAVGTLALSVGGTARFSLTNALATLAVDLNLGTNDITNATAITASAAITGGSLLAGNLSLSANTVAAIGALNLNSSTNQVLLTANPTVALGAATKQYVDAIASGLTVKSSVRVKTTALLPAHVAGGSGVGKTLTMGANGILTIDGVNTVINDRILVDDLGTVTAADRGIYTVTTVGNAGAAAILTRSTDADSNTEVVSGMFMFVSEGVASQDNGFVLTTNDPIVVDTTPLSFTQFTGVSSDTASSVGVGGVSVFKQKLLNNFEFNSINAASTKITVVLDAGNNEVDIDVDETNVNHNNLNNLTLGDPHTQYMLKAGSAMTGNLDLGTNSITNSSAVTASGAVTGGSLVAGNLTLAANTLAAVGALTLNSTTNQVLLPADPSVALGAVTMQYADAIAAAALPLAGGTMTGSILADDGGTAAIPAIAFDTDLNTGLYRPAADQIGLSTNGVLRLTIANAAITAAVDLNMATNNITGATAITASGAVTGGTLVAGNTTISTNAVTTVGAITLSSSTDQVLLTADPTVALGAATRQFVEARLALAGGAMTGDLTLTSSTNLVFTELGGADTITITAPAIAASYTLTLPVDDGAPAEVLTTNGAGVLSWSAVAAGAFLALDGTTSMTGAINASTGTAALPSYTFDTDLNTGLYNLAADQIGFSTNGVLRTSITNTLLKLNSVNTEYTAVAAAGLANATAAGDFVLFFDSSNANMLSYKDSAGAVTNVETAGGDNLGNHTATTQIQGTVAGTAALPSYTFTTDLNTGLYRPAADSIGLSTAGVLRLTIAATITAAVDLNMATNNITGATAITASGAVTGGTLVAGNTTISTNAVTTVGAITLASSTDQVLLTADPTVALGAATRQFVEARLALAGGTMTGAINAAIGTAALPSYTFDTDVNTGLYRPAADQIGLSTNGVLRTSITNTLLKLNSVNTEYTAVAAAGLANATAAGDFVLFFDSSNANMLSYKDSAGGITNVETAGGDNLGNHTATTQIQGTVAGTAALPSYTFTTDLNTGLYRPAADSIGLSTAGVLRLTIAAAITAAVDLNMATNNITGATAITASGAVTGGTLVAGNTTISTNAVTTVGAITLSSSTDQVLLTADPTVALGSATKQYVDSIASGLSVREPVRVKTAALLPAHVAAGASIGKTLTMGANGILTVDGVNTVLNDRILVDDSGTVTAVDRGIYTVTVEGTAGVAAVLTRATDADTNAEVIAGMFMFATEGALFADSGHVLITNNPIDVDVTNQSYSQFTGVSSDTASNVGVTGVGVFVNKVGNNFRFKNITGGTGLTVTNDAANNEIDLTLSLANIDHNSLNNLTTGDPHTQYLAKAGGIMTGSILADDGGTAALPAIAFDTDLNTGLYRPAADSIGLSTAGVLRLTIAAAITAAVDLNMATNNITGATAITASGAVTGGTLVAGNTTISTNAVTTVGAITLASSTDQVLLTADPTVALGAATRQFVEARLALAGGAMTGDLTLTSSTNLVFTELGGADTITITAPAIAASYTLTLPVDDGAPAEVLTTNGAGVLSWSAVAAGAFLALDGTTSMTGAINASTGTAALPALNFNGDLNTGLYQTAADSIGISTNGILRLTVNNSGLLLNAVTAPAAIAAGQAQVYTESGDPNKLFFMGENDAPRELTNQEHGHKQAVLVATSANVDLTGVGPVIIGGTVDGILLSASDRVLVKNQTTTANNGVYIVSTIAATAPSRAAGFNTSDQFAPGTKVLVTNGNISNNRTYYVSTYPVTVGVNPWLWTQSESSEYTAGVNIVAGDIISGSSAGSVFKFNAPFSNSQTIIAAASTEANSFAAAFDDVNQTMLFGYRDAADDFVLHAATVGADGTLTPGVAVTVYGGYDTEEILILNVGAGAWCIFDKHPTITQRWVVYGATTVGTVVTQGGGAGVQFGPAANPNLLIDAVYCPTANRVVVAIRSTVVTVLDVHVITMAGAAAPTVGAAVAIVPSVTLTRDIKIATYVAGGADNIVVAAGDRYRAGIVNVGASIVDTLGNILIEPVASTTVFLDAANPGGLVFSPGGASIECHRNAGTYPPVNTYPTSLAISGTDLVFNNSTGYSSGSYSSTSLMYSTLAVAHVATGVDPATGRFTVGMSNRGNGDELVLFASIHPTTNVDIGLSQRQSTRWMFEDTTNEILLMAYRNSTTGDFIFSVFGVQDFHDFLGIAQNDALIGEVVNVAVRGTTSKAHTGLTPNTKYYINSDNPTVLTTAVTLGAVAGLAISATEMVLTGPGRAVGIGID